MANFNLNYTILGGRLTSDVELKATQSGVSFCSFTIAVNRKYQQNGKQQTDFINCNAWRQTAEFVSKYFKKGSSICVIGEIQTREWTDNNGQKRFATDVKVNEANFVDSKNDNAGNGFEAPRYNDGIPNNLEELSDDDELPF